ncbi:MAG: hypothetical protein KGZ63_13380 [Clostridiales bacterium]|nr:hypothetical protein [Clostridiales bacterium]
MQRIVNILAPKHGEMKRVVHNAADVKALRVKLEPGEKADECIVDAPVLLFVMDGDGTLHIEDESYPLTDGDITVVPAGKTRYLEAGKQGFRLLAVQSHQADKTCGLCALLENCVSLKD